ncbi:MAG: tRNA pseudouridine(55) synthase TruB [Deinococcales bacterium]
MAVHIINKPLGWTSHDVVARARKLLGTRKVGHTGTLDPLATGVLILVSEESTKLVPFLEKTSKDYIGYVSLGASTPTLDAEGPVVQRADCRLQIAEKTRLEAILAGFVGKQMQVPPQYSAIHVDGRRAYDMVRAGEEVKLEPRAIEVLFLELQEVLPHMPVDAMFPPALGEFVTLKIAVGVSSGTYIRSLARDIGAALEMPAHLAGLIRTRVGNFKLEDAIEVESLRPDTGIPDLAALEFPILELSAKEARDVRDGKKISSQFTGRATLMSAGQLVAIADGDGSSLKVVRAWQ